MRIVFIGNSYGDVAGNLAEEQWIARDFQTLGYDMDFVERTDWKDGLSKLEGRIDIFFICGVKSVGEQDIPELKKKYKAKVIYWTPDFLMKEHLPIAQFKASDLALTKMYIYNHIFEEHGINHLYWPFDVATPDFRPEGMDTDGLIHFFTANYYPKEVPAGFTGSWVHDTWRAKFLKSVQLKFPELYITTSSMNELANGQGEGAGPEWGLNNIRQGIFEHKFNQLIGITKVSLAIDGYMAEGYWSNRIARTMCSGGFVLAYYTKGMERTFKDYVVYFKDVDDCVDKINYYVEHDRERKALAERGYRYADINLRSIVRAKELKVYIEHELVG